MKQQATDPEIVVISDVHLGTFGCRAKELYWYLKSVKPEKLILNGDIIDIWQFRKRYFPKWHLKVIKQIFSMAAKGTEVHYITGNHDELLRRFSSFDMGQIKLADHLILPLQEGSAWFFHGDVFDASIQKAKWIAKLGGWGYDLLILINSLSNRILTAMGREKYSFSQKIKHSVKKAVRYINDFEHTAAELAIDQHHAFVCCGHIHQAQIRRYKNTKGATLYLNSGDWVESLTALEYRNGEWSIYQFDPAHFTAEKEKQAWPIEGLKLVDLASTFPFSNIPAHD